MIRVISNTSDGILSTLGEVRVATEAARESKWRDNENYQHPLLSPDVQFLALCRVTDGQNGVLEAEERMDALDQSTLQCTLHIG